MKIRCVVTDARRYCVEPAWCAASFDLPFYRTLPDRAYAEIAAAFPPGAKGKRAPGWSYDDPVRKSGNKNAALL
jgi:hypothetical protein